MIIPPIFDQPGAGFVLLPAGVKFPPHIPPEGWQKPENAHSFLHAEEHAAKGGNVGALAGIGPYIGLDLDEPQAFEGLTLPVTTTWETRPGRLGMRFICHDCTPRVLADYGKPANHAQFKLYDGRRTVNGKYPAIGEIKLQRTYQVIPPSWKEVDGQKVYYKMVSEIPLAEISLEQLIWELVKMGIVLSEKPATGTVFPEKSKNKLEANVQKLDTIKKDAANKQKDNKAKAKQFFQQALQRAEVGNRNDVGFDLVCQLRDLGLNEAEASEYMRLYACAVPEGGDPPYTEKAAFDSLEQAYSRTPRDPPKSEERRAEEAKGPNVIDALKALMDNETKIPKKHTWKWRVYKTRAKKAIDTGFLSYKQEEEAHKVLDAFKDLLADLGIDYEGLYPIARAPKPKKEEFPEEIKAEALEVLSHGNPMQYIADSCGRIVLGAENAFKKITCCISAQNVNQTAGMHPKLSGDSSGGKTITIYAFAHHLPWEMVIKGSMSSKAGFYHDDGNRVLRVLDDYAAGNEDLDTVIKQTSSEFHEPYAHRTVVNHEAATLKIGKEQTWAITSVDSSQDIQVLNRQMPINVDDSVELTKLVNNKTVERYSKGEVQLPTDKTVLVSRAIFQMLRDEGYINVKIPFGDMIEWLDTSNRRNPSMFLDLLVSITAMNRYQREQDKEGYYLAAEEDFKTAKALFTDKDAEELVKRLTTRERDVINLLIKTSDGLTRDEIASKLSVAPDRISQIINGQKGYGGLKQKVQIAETKISLMTRIDEDLKRTVHKTVYSLKDYDHFTGFDAVVRLKTASDEPPKQAKHELSIELSKQTAKHNDDLSKISKEEKEKDREEIDTKYSANATKFDSLTKNPNHTNLLSSMAADNESQCLGDAKPYLACLADPLDNGSDAKPCLVQGGGAKHTKSDHAEPVKLRFLKDYRTNIPKPDEPSKYIDKLYLAGEVADIPAWKAKQWIEKGIAVGVEA